MSGVLVAALAVPAAASADEPTPEQFKNAAKQCKALKKASGTNNFNQLYGTKKNAYGKCVSALAKQKSKKDEQQQKQAQQNAAQQCKTERSDPNFAAGHDGKTFNQFYGSNKNGKNAFGKCVSRRSKSEEAQRKSAHSNAAKDCKAERAADPAAFAAKYGTNKNGKNAYGKCVSQKAKAKKQKADAADAAKIKARKAAAKDCATERKADPAAFREKYGTNKNKRNAFGKCVSQAAKAKTA
jgi:hypothetical protein